MKTEKFIKNILVVVLATIMIMSFSGCSLAKKDADKKSTGNDVVVGVLVTKDSLPKDKVYADAIDADKDSKFTNYKFSNIDGYSYYVQFLDEDYTTSATAGDDEYFHNVKLNCNFTDSDENKEKTNALIADFYINSEYEWADENEKNILYINPIYLDKDGKIFAVKAKYGMDVQSDTTIFYESESDISKDDNKYILKGKSTINLNTGFGSDTLNILEFDKKDKIINTTEIQVDKNNTSFKIQKNTQYVIVENINNGKKTSESFADTSSNEKMEENTINVLYENKNEFALGGYELSFTKID